MPRVAPDHGNQTSAMAIYNSGEVCYKEGKTQGRPMLFTLQAERASPCHALLEKKGYVN